jgi:hypothetical protein
VKSGSKNQADCAFTNFIERKMRYYICAMLKDIKPTGKKDTRSGFGDAMTELGRTNPNVVPLRPTWQVR